MSELDAAVQLVKLEIDGMNYCFRLVGNTGIDVLKAFAKMIKNLGSLAWNNHKTKKLDEIVGSVTLKDFRKKYAGDDVVLIELKDADVKSFLDMCGKEGVALTKLPDLDLNDGYSQFMIAASTSQTIKFNFEKINRWHVENDVKSEAKEAEQEPYECGREISATDYVHTAPGDTVEEKEEAFKEKVKEMFPSGEGKSVEDIDLTDNKEVIDFLQNASKDQKMMLAEESNYKSFTINENMIVGEDNKQISLQTYDGEQIEIDKNLVFSENGKTLVYCPAGEPAAIGDVRCKGKSLNAEKFKEKLEIKEVSEKIRANLEKGKVLGQAGGKGKASGLKNTVSEPVLSKSVAKK